MFYGKMNCNNYAVIAKKRELGKSLSDKPHIEISRENKGSEISGFCIFVPCMVQQDGALSLFIICHMSKNCTVLMKKRDVDKPHII